MTRPAFLKHNGRRVYLPPHPHDSCPAKHRYDTEIAARMGAQARISALGRAGANARRWVYPCSCCEGWHYSRSSLNNPRPAVTLTQLVEGTTPFDEGACHDQHPR